jgi:hypothetical protein
MSLPRSCPSERNKATGANGSPPPLILAPEPVLGSHSCVALSSAQIVAIITKSPEADNTARGLVDSRAFRFRKGKSVQGSTSGQDETRRPFARKPLQALSGERNPSFDTILEVIGALGNCGERIKGKGDGRRGSRGL